MRDRPKEIEELLKEGGHNIIEVSFKACVYDDEKGDVTIDITERFVILEDWRDTDDDDIRPLRDMICLVDGNEITPIIEAYWDYDGMPEFNMEKQYIRLDVLKRIIEGFEEFVERAIQKRKTCSLDNFEHNMKDLFEEEIKKTKR